MPSASLTLLGGFDARLESGAPLGLPTHKYKALLAFLAVPAGQMHPRDTLVALLWGDRSHDQGRTALRQALWVLRKALNSAAPAGLMIDGDLIGIDPAAVRVDVTEFERTAAAVAVSELERAAALYRGEFLAGMSTRETQFEEWLTVQRARLGEMALQSLGRLLQHQHKTGHLEAAVQTALRLVALDPLEEPVHRVLMQIYAELGRRAAALRQYRACVTILQRELGADPDAETRALYRAIVAERLTTALKPPPGAPTPSAMMAAPLVGRTLETALIRKALDEAVVGRGQAIVILGEAGIGKTRFVEALTAEATSRGARVIIGHCFEAEQVLPYGAWVDALHRGCVAADRDMFAALPPRSRTALARFVPEFVASDREQDPSTADHMQVFQSVACLVETLIARQPLVLIVEDAHWADDISLRLLSFVSRRVHDTLPVLVVLTARDEELVDAPALQRCLDDLDRHQMPLKISLGPLDRDDTERLISMLGGGRDSARLARLTDRICVESHGNPFVVVEMLHALRDGADADGSGSLRLPERVRHLVARRLERLSAAARQLVATAAVIGRDCGFGLLRRASGLGESDAIEALEELVRRRIFIDAGEGFDFSHDRIREVARRALLPPRRRILHRQVAETLEALGPAAVEANLAVLGYHYREAEQWDRALPSLRRAGLEALARGAYREAAVMMAQAVDAQAHLPAGSVTPQDVFDLCLDAARPLYATGDIPGFAERIRDAQFLAETLGDRRRLATAYIHTCESLRTEHEHRRAIAAGEAGLGLAIDIGDQGLQDQANFQLGLVHAWRGAHAQALAYFEVATTNVPRLGPNTAMHLVPYIPGLGSRTMSLAALGRFAEAWPLAREAVRLVDAGAQPAAYPFATLGTLCVLQGRFDEAVSHLQRALERCRERGFQVVRATCTAALAEAFALSGRQREALAVLEETAEWYTSTPAPSHRSLVLTRLGRALLVVGRSEDARRFGSRALDLATQSGERGVEASVRQLLGEIALNEATAPGNHEADRQFCDALVVADELGLRPLAAHCHAGLGRLHQRHGERDQAQRHLTTASAMYREMEMAPWRSRGRTTREQLRLT